MPCNRRYPASGAADFKDRTRCKAGIRFLYSGCTNCEYGEHGTFLFADCGLNQDPTAEELAAIADTSAKSFKTLVGAKPIIAMLSHSTKGSAKHPLADKVVKAVEIAHEQYPGLTLDGELQTDAAIVLC